MTTPSRLVFFGTEDFSVSSLRALIDAGYDIAAIVTKPDTVRGRGRKIFVHPVKQIGLDHGILVLQPEKLRDITNELQQLNASAGVLVSFGKIIPQCVLDIFNPVGIINIHPSQLPKYRGPSPIEATILAGDTHTAVSIMKLDAGMDTGPVYTQRAVSIHGNESKQSLMGILAEVGARLLICTLPDILSGQLAPKPQENIDASITTLIRKEDGILDPLTDTATTLERKTRAYQGFPKPRLSLFNNDVIVTSASIVENETDGALVIPCAEKTWFSVERLIAPSGREMSGADFVRGYTKQT